MDSMLSCPSARMSCREELLEVREKVGMQLLERDRGIQDASEPAVEAAPPVIQLAGDARQSAAR